MGNAILGLVVYGLGFAAAVVFVSFVISTYANRNPPPNTRGSSPVCIASRGDCPTGAFQDDRPAYGRGDWQPAVQAGRIATVREVSAATPYHGRRDEAQRGQMVAPTHGEEWDYPVVIPERAGDVPIPVENWPVRAKR